MSAKVQKTNIEMLNAIRADLPATWTDVIPVLSQANFYQYGMALSTQDYVKEANQAFYQLFNKIGLTLFKSGNINNRYGYLKTGSFELGDAVEEIFVGVTKGETFQEFGDAPPPGGPQPNPGRDQFEKFPNNVEPMYHKRNRKDDYPITLAETQARAAMRNTYGLSTLMQLVMGTMYRNNTRDEDIYARQMVSQYFNAPPTGVAFQGSQIVPVARPVDDTTGAAFYRTIQEYTLRLWFNSTAYNAKQVLTSSADSGLYLFLRADILPSLSVDTLSRSFNPDRILTGHPNATNVVPNEVKLWENFGEDYNGQSMDNCLAILCDRDTFQIYQNLLRLTNASNARDLYDNYYLHIWETYAASYFSNCVFFFETTPTP